MGTLRNIGMITNCYLFQTELDKAKCAATNAIPTGNRISRQLKPMGKGQKRSEIKSGQPPHLFRITVPT